MGLRSAPMNLPTTLAAGGPDERPRERPGPVPVHRCVCIRAGPAAQAPASPADDRPAMRTAASGPGLLVGDPPSRLACWARLLLVPAIPLVAAELAGGGSAPL